MFVKECDDLGECEVVASAEMMDDGLDQAGVVLVIDAKPKLGPRFTRTGHHGLNAKLRRVVIAVKRHMLAMNLFNGPLGG